MKAYTDINVLLDRSGSMWSIKDSMQKAYNEFIHEHMANPTTKVTLVQFDDQNDQDTVYQCVPVKAVEKLSLSPRGNTPLVDAFAKLIDRTGERLRNMSESERPDQVLFVVITDGQENASRTYKRHDVQTRVTNQRDKFNWNFIYLGANQDAIAEAKSYGISPSFAMMYNASDIGTQNSFRSLTSNTMAYSSSVGSDRSNSKSLAFDEKQRKQATEQDSQK